MKTMNVNNHDITKESKFDFEFTFLNKKKLISVRATNYQLALIRAKYKFFFETKIKACKADIMFIK